MPVGDLDSRRFEVRLSLPAGQWVIGAPVQVGLPTGHAEQIVTVPRDALVIRENGTFIYIVEDGRVRKALVSTGMGAQARIEVVGERIPVGALVVVTGAELLRDGQLVSWSE